MRWIVLFFIISWLNKILKSRLFIFSCLMWRLCFQSFLLLFWIIKKYFSSIFIMMFKELLMSHVYPMKPYEIINVMLNTLETSEFRNKFNTQNSSDYWVYFVKMTSMTTLHVVDYNLFWRARSLDLLF